MKHLWLRDFPITGDLLKFILSHHCVGKIELLCLEAGNITNQMVEELVKKIKERKEPVN